MPLVHLFCQYDALGYFHARIHGQVIAMHGFNTCQPGPAFFIMSHPKFAKALSIDQPACRPLSVFKFQLSVSLLSADIDNSEERRVGTECVSTSSSRVPPSH